MTKTNYDRYLEEQMTDPDFVRRFERAGRAWDVALKLAVKKTAAVKSKPAARKSAARKTTSRDA